MQAFDSQRPPDRMRLLALVGQCVVGPLFLVLLFVIAVLAGSPPFPLGRLHVIHMLALSSGLVTFWSILPERGKGGHALTLWFFPAAIVLCVYFLFNALGGEGLELGWLWAVIVLDAALAAYAVFALAFTRPRLAAGVVAVAMIAGLIFAASFGMRTMALSHLAEWGCAALGLLVLIGLSSGPMGPVRWGITLSLFIIAILILWGEGPPVRDAVRSDNGVDYLRRNFAAHIVSGVGLGQSRSLYAHAQTNADLIAPEYLPDASLQAWARQSEEAAPLFGKASPKQNNQNKVSVLQVAAVELGGAGILFCLALLWALTGMAVYGIATRPSTNDSLLLAGILGLTIAFFYSFTLLPGPLSPPHFILSALWVGLFAGIIRRVMDDSAVVHRDTPAVGNGFRRFTIGGVFAVVLLLITAMPLIGASRDYANPDTSPEENAKRLELARRLHPFSSNIQLHLAEVYTNTKSGRIHNTAEVDNAWRQAIRRDPYNPRAYVQWARYHIANDNVDAARDIVELSRRRLPESLLMLLWEAEIAKEAGDIRLEERARRRALQIAETAAAPLRPRLLMQLQSTCLRANAPTQARLAANQYLQYNPADPFAALRVIQLSE